MVEAARKCATGAGRGNQSGEEEQHESLAVALKKAEVEYAMAADVYPAKQCGCRERRAMVEEKIRGRMQKRQK